MIYTLISFFLDTLLSLSIDSAYQNINIFFPIIFVSSIPISYVLIKSKKLFFITYIIFGILLDLLYSDIIFINLYYFLLTGLFCYIFYSNHKTTYLNITLISILSFILYDIYIFLILILIGYSNFNISSLFYKINHSLILNISYIIISILILKSRILVCKNCFKK